MRALRFVVLLALAGCDGSPRTYPVEGKVTFPDGTPLAGAVVEFESEGAPEQRVNARGVTGPDGSYKLTTFKDGDGAVAGTHRVIVVAAQDSSGNMSGPDPQRAVALRFRKFEESGLTCIVKPEANHYDITVEKP
jgi:hypothetical protein